VLRHLAPEQRAAGLPAPSGDARDELVDQVGDELTDRDVVEEEQRLGAVRGDVVDRHRDAVDADGVVTPELAGQERLGADAVGRRHQHRVLVAIAIEREQPAEAADVTDDLTPERLAHAVLDALDRLLPRADRDAGALVRLAHQISTARDLGLGQADLDGLAARHVVLLEHVLAQPDRHLDWVLAGEARVAGTRHRSRRWPRSADRG